jgi:integrase
MKEISRRTKAKGDLPGSIYLRGKVYWIKYYKDGKPLRESARSGDYETAQAELAKRINEVKHGKNPNIQLPRVKFEDLSKDFLSDYRINEKKSLKRAEASEKHLKGFFGGMRIIEITTSKIREYIEKRLEDEAAKGTINRELSALKRMLNLGAQCTPPKVDRVPHIPTLKENNIRKGFFEHSDFTALRDNLPDHLKPVITFGYVTGWRISEILDLEWSQVDRKNGIVRLDPGVTKNEEARTIYLDEELTEDFRELWDRRKKLGTALPHVFLNKKGTDRIDGFRKAWMAACKAAQIGPKKFHDFRRTAVRNMVRAGIPERVAMTISGHKTRSVFDRYNIVNDRDLKLAAQAQREYLKGQMGTKMGTISDFSHHKEKRATAKLP